MFGRNKTNEVRPADVAQLQRRGAAAGVGVHNVAGGMSAWAAAGLRVVRDDGSPGRVR